MTPKMRPIDYVAMVACYGLVGLLFWMLRDQIKFWLYALGVL